MNRRPIKNKFEEAYNQINQKTYRELHNYPYYSLKNYISTFSLLITKKLCRFELSNGIQKEEVGAADVDASGNSIEKVKGSYAFYAPDGSYQRVEYTVDENGYRANILNNFKESPLLRPTTGIPPVTDRLYIHGIPSLSGGKKEISGAAIKTLSG